jgi:hypothetical protein
VEGEAGLSTVTCAEKRAIYMVPETSMELEKARVGTKVLVQLDYTQSDRQGAIGTIKKRYGTSDYRAFEVLFPDGHTALYWDHQLEVVRKPAYRPRWRWTIW